MARVAVYAGATLLNISRWVGRNGITPVSKQTCIAGKEALEYTLVHKPAERREEVTKDGE
ncbi:hypothetical protein PthBH41_36270 [Parageobacillus thermoglucosidasius]|nr:hypothetical protein PthBH41_36270 [Parageobacillus thermoglucosidasius]GAJ43573.1 hypothetical protein GT2_10_01340 [Parageobacillus thermoglucosidasius NBRC 107763]